MLKVFMVGQNVGKNLQGLYSQEVWEEAHAFFL